MVKVHFTESLKRFYPSLKEERIVASNIAELVKAIEELYPGISGYLLDERGRCRRHVNIFIGEKLIVDRDELGDKLEEGDEVFFIQALSGG
ncbi:MAG: hypothetical protein RJA52_271 [Bacteroidota bacterium]